MGGGGIVVRGDQQSVHIEPTAVDPNAWLSSNALVTTDRLSNVMLNNLANDIRHWRGTVNAGGNILANVVLENVGIPGALTDPTTTLGDMIVRGTTISRLPVGANGQVLTANSSQPLGVYWATPTGGGGGGAVASVFGRTGAVVAQTGDYTAAQISGAVATNRAISTGTGLTGGGDLSANLTLSVVDDTTTQRIQVAQAATLIGTRRQINFVAGTGTTLNVTDNAVNNRVDISVSLSGTGPPTPLAIAVNGALIGTRSELNLIGGGGTTITGSDNAGAGRVDVTITAAGGGGAVSSIFGRTGAVVAQTADYTAAQVTNAVSTQGSYADPSWITSLAWGKLTGVPATFAPSAHTHAAADVTSGVFAVARLGTGSPSSSNFLRGDGAWAVPPGGTGGSQTPWVSNIDAANYSLNSVQNIGIGLGSVAGFPLVIAAGASTSHAIYVVANGLAGYGYYHQDSSPTAAPGIAVMNDVNDSAVFFMGGSNHPLPFYRKNAVFSSSTMFSLFAADRIDLWTDSHTRMTVTKAGNVGIGAAYAPNTTLQVMGPHVPNIGVANFSSPGTIASITVEAGTLAGSWVSCIFRAAGTYLGEIATFAGGLQFWNSTATGQPPLQIDSGGTLFVQSNLIVDQSGANTGLGANLIFGPGSGEGIGSNRGAGFNQYGLDLYAGGYKRLCIYNTGQVTIGSGAYGRFAGDLGIARGDGTGAIYFGGSNAVIYYDGTRWSFTPALSGSVNVLTGTTFVGNQPTQTIQFYAGGTGLSVSGSWTDTGMGFGYHAAVTFIYASDIRVKKNIRPLEGGLSVINALRPVESEFNGLAQTGDGEKVFSIIAQELKTILPAAVNSYPMRLRPEDADMVDVLSYNPHAILFQSVLAIQQLDARIKELETYIDLPEDFKSKL